MWLIALSIINRKVCFFTRRFCGLVIYNQINITYEIDK